MSEPLDDAIGLMDIPPPAADFVRIVPELSGCGRYAFGSWDILVNSNETRTIWVEVLTSWTYLDHGYTQTDTYQLEKKSRLNLGCDFWRGDYELQEFDRKITRAFYG